MKGNVLTELRKLVNDLYTEGRKEVFAISVMDKGNHVVMQVVDFDLNVEDLDRASYKNIYTQAEKVVKLTKYQYGYDFKAINAIMSNGTHGEELSYDKGVLKVYHLNV